jgi:dienelactone hydrolase
MMRRARTALAVVLSVVAAASTAVWARGIEAARTRVIRLPSLTGSAPVGTFSLHLVDRSRTDPTMASGHRELMVQLWYPAARSAGPLARYMPARVAALIEREDHVPAGTISSIRVRAHLRARVAAGDHPVLLFSPGSSEMRSVDTALVEDLASSGYVVAAIDHTHESELVEFPGRRIVRGTFVDMGTASNERALRVRVADVHFLVDHLPALNRQGALARHLDLRQTGIFGFSLGGATAAASMLADPRLKAGADLDGSIYGPARRQGLERPFMLMLERRGIRLDPSVAAFAVRLRGAHLLLGVSRTAHESFTDFVWIKPQLARIAPASASQIQVGRIGPHAVIDESAYLTAFFNRYLRHETEPLLARRSPRYPDVVFLRAKR